MTEAAEDRLEVKPRLTVELCLYGLIWGLALAVRLLGLARWPLLDGEAGLALAAWRLARGLPATVRGHSPLLFHANALLFFLTGFRHDFFFSIAYAFYPQLVDHTLFIRMAGEQQPGAIG